MTPLFWDHHLRRTVLLQVSSRLMKRNGLCHYADRLHECIVTAASVVDADLPALIVDSVVDGCWSTSAANVPSLCRTLASLYFEAYRPRCPLKRKRVRDTVVGHVTGRLLAAATLELVDRTAVDACRACAEFCGRLIDDVAAGSDARVSDGRDCMGRVAEVLVFVYRNHRNYECVDHAGRLLRKLIGGGAGVSGQCLVGDACRMAVMEALVKDRLQTMTDDLIDNTF